MGKILLTLVLLLGLVGYTFTYAEGESSDSIKSGDSNPVIQDSCTSGGPGAVICGQGVELKATIAAIGAYCTVSCDTPYYACCSATGCTCKSAILTHQ